MTLYTYLGPYSYIKFNDGTGDKEVFMGHTVDVDPAFVDDQMRRGFHLFELAGPDAPPPDAAAEPEPVAEAPAEPPAEPAAEPPAEPPAA